VESLPPAGVEIPAPIAAPGEKMAPAPREPAPTHDFADTLALAQEKWELVKQVCKQKSFSAAALLNHAHPVLLEPGELPVLVVQAEFPFHQQKLREVNQRGAVEWALEQVLELPMRIKVVLAGTSDTGGAEGARPGDGSGGGRGSAPAGGNRTNGKGTS